MDVRFYILDSAGGKVLMVQRNQCFQFMWNKWNRLCCFNDPCKLQDVNNGHQPLISLFFLVALTCCHIIMCGHIYKRTSGSCINTTSSNKLKELIKMRHVCRSGKAQNLVPCMGIKVLNKISILAHECVFHLGIGSTFLLDFQHQQEYE